MTALALRHHAPAEAPVPAPTPVGATVVALFWDRVDRWPARPALRHHEDGTWRAISWSEYGRRVTELAAGLAAIGVAPGDRVGILAGNQTGWHEADLAILASGATSVPAYPTSASGQVAHVLGHSAARCCFVGDRDQLAKVLLRRPELPDLEHVVLLGPVPDGLGDDAFLLHVDDLRALGRDRLAVEPDVVAERSAAVTPETVATIVYTSGTTGPPKGAVLTHDNLRATIQGIVTVVPIGPDDRFLSFLPLSHIAERIVSDFGQIVSGGETWFARSLSTLAEDLQACRPTIFFAVPRVWEKLQAAILEEVATAPAPLRALVDAYLDDARRRTDATRAGVRASVASRLRYAALDRLVGARIRAGTGLDEAHLLVSGAAPIDPELLWWFTGIGMPISEVYGQTEDCGPASINPPGAVRVGSVGLPLPGLEVRVAEDGELLVRGPSVCAGYHRDPDATAAAFEADGWFHTGDLGRISADGRLYVTGRKKDLIVTSSGKNIAPQELEVRLRAHPLVAQAVVVGDRRPYLTALLALDTEATTAWARDHGKMADLEALHDDPDLLDELRVAVDQLNSGRSPIEQVKAWRLVPRELTVAAGELTPTLKVRREVVTERYRGVIDEMYGQRLPV